MPDIYSDREAEIKVKIEGIIKAKKGVTSQFNLIDELNKELATPIQETEEVQFVQAIANTVRALIF